MSSMMKGKSMIALNDVSVGQLMANLPTPHRDAAGAGLAIRMGIGMTGHLEPRPAASQWRDAINAWLCDTSADAIRSTANLLGPVAERACDPAGSALLLAAGVNPLALLAIERLLHLSTNGGHTVQRDGETIAHIGLGWYSDVLPPDLHDTVTIRLAPGIWWDGTGMSIHDGRIPSTLIPSLAGRPLREVVDHPALEGAMVTRVVATEIGTWKVETDRCATPRGWREALLSAPALEIAA